MKPHCSRTVLIRLSLCLTLLACVSVCCLNLLSLRRQLINLTSDLHQQTAARRVSETQLSATSAKLRETTASLSVVTDEREQAVANALAQAERAEKLAKKLAVFQQQRDQAEADLAQFRAAGMEPDQIVYAARELKKVHGALSAAET